MAFYKASGEERKKASVGQFSFIPPLLPTLQTDLSYSSDYLYELKLDGYRLQIQVKNKKVKIFSRNGLDWSHRFKRIVSSLRELNLKDCILDGEAVVLDYLGKSRFHLLQQQLKEGKDHEIYLFVFDLLFYDDEDLREFPLWERKQKLQEILNSKSSYIRYLDHISGHGKEFFSLSCSEGLEGIVAKKENSKYTSGRNSNWVKLKCEQREEFIIIGWTEHSSVPGKIGALLLAEDRPQGLSYIGKVGTGFNHSELTALKRKLQKMEINEKPLFEVPTQSYREHWVRPSIYAEIKFQNKTVDGVLRGAVYQGLREDKVFKEGRVLGHNQVTSPDKIIFKEEGITKEMIANYYEAVSDEILKFSQHRPLSIVRCPQGTDKECFFQKHLDSKRINGLHFFKIQDKEELNDYFSFISKKGIVGLVQLNAYEFHVWNCLDDKVESPNQIVFDLDPDEGISWKELSWAAFELKELLMDLNLESYIKLTGGKGIHIHVPIIRDYLWEQVKSFAYTIGLELVERYPKKFTTNMSKRARKGKIFFDYLRNAHGATAVAPYSLRTKKRASVAVPIEWDELEGAGTGALYGIKEALEKIKKRKRDPWEGFTRNKQRLFLFDLH